MRRRAVTSGAAALALLLAADHAPPTLFAPGVVSTAANELNSAFTPDGRAVYFTRTAGADGRFGVVLASRALGGGRWSAPAVASFSGRWPDYDPFVTPDGRRLLFISKRPNGDAGAAPRADFDLWVVDRAGDRAGDRWGAPRSLGPTINGDGDELYPSVAADGTLYFSACGRADSRGRCDLYRARFVGGRYLAPESLGDAINTPASETDAYVAPDQSYLVFTAYGRADAVGDGDLYVAFARGDGWTAPRPLDRRVNTVAREYCPIVSPDGKHLYFTSTRGFQDLPRARALTAAELRDSLAGPRNGAGDVYRVPIAALGAPD